MARARALEALIGKQSLLSLLAKPKRPREASRP
jgi:hypothetical protein